MTSKELIKTLMTEHDITNAEMAKTLGITQAALWDRLNPKKSDNTTVAKLGDMLSVMGYKIMVVPDETPIPEGGYEVGRTDMVG